MSATVNADGTSHHHRRFERGGGRWSARSRRASTAARGAINLVVQHDMDLGLESVDQDVDRFAALPPVEDGMAEFVRDGDALADRSAGGWPAPQDIPREAGRELARLRCRFQR